MTAALAIMAKAPLPGLCKTRLARDLGAERAADLYRHFLLDTIDLARRVPGVTVSAVCPDGEHARLLREILPPEVGVDPQEGEGLLAGLASAFALNFARGFERVALIDGDSPTLPPRHVADALDRLADHDLVLGPCDDGGYYLIAARALYPSLFFGVTYRGESICEEKVRRARALGLAVTLVDPWYDVDTDEDYRRLLADLRSDESLARHTRGHLGLTP
jgi:rSAM/selenodomain-associated transferase 1